MARTSRRLHAIIEGFRIVFDPQDYRNAQDPASLKLVSEAIFTESWHFENEVVMFVSGQAENLRGRCRACPCHPVDCLAEAKKGSLFECPNIAKSCIGPYIYQILDEAFEQMNELPSKVEPASIGGGYYHSLLTSSLTDLAGLLNFKSSFRHKGPWIIWKIKSPESMAMVRDHYLERRESNSLAEPLHRVEDRFFEPDSEMDKLCVDYINGDAMDEKGGGSEGCRPDGRDPG